MTIRTVAIVGARMAGLACAERLTQHGMSVRSFDKGCGAGGRMLSRRVKSDGTHTTFGHSAQYFTARDE